MSSELVLLTGSSGYIGAHIAQNLLDENYRVRLVARSAKKALLEKRYASYGDRVQVVVVDDLALGDFTDALAGVNAVIHAASPLPGRMDAKGTLDAAIRGTTNIVGQVANAGIKRVVVTSSIAALFTPDKFTSIAPLTVTEKDWFEVTESEVLTNSENAFFVYTASKALAEKAVWALAAQHPELDVTTILPPFTFGPFAPGIEFAKGDTSAMSSNGIIYGLINGVAGQPLPETLPTAPSGDVRDVARAHVLALRAPASAVVGQKRFIVTSGTFAWGTAIEHILEAHPELAPRLADPNSEHALVRSELVLDTTRTEKVLGMEFIGFEKTVLDSVDDLLRVEEGWETRD